MRRITFVFFCVESRFRFAEAETANLHERIRAAAPHRLLVGFLGLVALFALVSCRSAADRDSVRLDQDKTAQAELNRINALLASSRPVTRVDVEYLSKLRA